MNVKHFDPRLYLVAGNADVDTRGLDRIVRDAVAGGVSLFQLREKDCTTRRFIETARSVAAALEGTGIPILINDRVDVALAANVQGVHIGQDDMHGKDARRLLGADAIIGLTVRSQDEIENAPVEVLDYLSIGGVFATSSKNNTRDPVGLDGLSELTRFARKRCDLPVTAIAGIGADSASDVMNCGVDGIAIISAITRTANPEDAARHLRETVDHALAQARGA